MESSRKNVAHEYGTVGSWHLGLQQRGLEAESIKGLGL